MTNLTIFLVSLLGILPLPLIENIFDDDLFKTNCILTNKSYLSIIDHRGYLYANYYSNQNLFYIDKLRLNQSLDIFTSVLVKLIFIFYFYFN